MNTDLHQEPEDAQTPSKKILQNELKEAMDALARSASRLFLSGLSAGLDIGFSLFLIAILHTLADGEFSKPVFELLRAVMYTFGFFLVIIGRSELFTEQTTLAILPLLSGQTSVKVVARLWGIVYVANLIGATAFAAIVVLAGPSLGIIEEPVFGEIARQVVSHSWWVTLLSAVLAGWLMGLLSWLVAAGRDTISQIVIVFVITAAIGLGKLHHSIVGVVEVTAGMFSGGDITAAQLGQFLFWSTIGNAAGGAFFVALLKYGHARASPGDNDHSAK